MSKSTRATAPSRRGEPAAALAALLALAAAGCTLNLAGHSAAPPTRLEGAQTASASPAMCVVDGVASSVGALRCFYTQLRICERSGAWRAPTPQEFLELAPGPCAEQQPAPPRARPGAPAARAR